MTSLDRIVIRAVLAGKVEFDTELPNRFANIGKAHFCRSVVDERWSLVFGHCDEDYSIPLGACANLAMNLGSRNTVTRATTKEKKSDQQSVDTVTKHEDFGPPTKSCIDAQEEIVALEQRVMWLKNALIAVVDMVNWYINWHSNSSSLLKKVSVIATAAIDNDNQEKYDKDNREDDRQYENPER